MKHSRISFSLAAIGLFAVLILSGCSSQANSNQNNADAQSAAGNNASQTGVVSSLRAKYADADSSRYDYQEPMYNLPEDYVFTFTNASDIYAEKDYDAMQNAYRVYADSAFAYPLEYTTSVFYSSENGTLTVGPSSAVLQRLDGKDVPTASVWGNAAKYWLVQYENPSTGEALEKPAVTVFTIARELDTPTVSFDVTEKGYARLSWKPVDGATGYRIYSGMVTAEGGISATSLTLVGETSNTEFTDFPGKAFSVDESGVLTQNSDFDGRAFVDAAAADQYRIGYWVIAYNNIGASNCSNMIDSHEVANLLVIQLSWDSTIGAGEADYGVSREVMSELPGYQPVVLGNTVVSPRVIDYSGAKMTEAEDGRITVIAPLLGTDLHITLYAASAGEGKTADQALQGLVERQALLEGKSSATAPQNDIDYVPATEPPAPSGSEATGAQTDQTETTDKSDNAVSNSTKPDSTKPNSATSDNATTDSATPDNSKPDNASSGTSITETSIPVTASSALGEYLALNLLNHNEQIDITGFNEAYDSDYLSDALMEAYYQNPLIGSLTRVGLDYNSGVLYAEYEYTADEQKKMQEAVQSEVRSVTDSIITTDMSDVDKEIAINDYLCSTAEYDNAALENAESHAYEYTDPAFADSFTPAGVLLNKSGVCASYAGAFKLLADEAGLQCVVVTGNLNGSMPHAWNRVRLDDQWLSVDTTNNDSEYCPNALLNVPDSVSASVLVEDREYLMDSSLSQMASTSDEQEYYHVEGKYYTVDTLPQALDTFLTEGGTFHIRSDYNLSEDQVISFLQQSVQNTGVSVENAGLFLGVVYVQTA